MRRTWPTIVSTEDGGKRPWAMGCRRLLEARNGKETDSFLGPPETNSPADTLILVTWDTWINFWSKEMKDN